MSNPIRDLGDGWYETEIHSGDAPEVWRYRADSMAHAREIRQRRVRKVSERKGITLSRNAMKWAKSGRV